MSNEDNQQFPDRMRLQSLDSLWCSHGLFQQRRQRGECRFFESVNLSVSECDAIFL